MGDLKLTVKQNCVIYCLQNGWVLVTDMEATGAIVGNNKSQYRINNGLFWRLFDMGLIYQNSREGHAFTLTEKGKSFKTKPVDLNGL